jgi:hypothetical protein
VDDAINTLIDFIWLNAAQERDIREVQYQGRKPPKSPDGPEYRVPLTYDEFKITKSLIINND